MSAGALVRGWCPSLFRPMESGDGWLARIRPQAGGLSAGLAQAVAEAALRFGNGIIEVTNRANIQIRGLQPDTIVPFAEAVAAAGAAAGEGSRVLVSPLLGADPALAQQTAPLLRQIDAALAGLALPPKFGVLLDGGGALPLAGITLDVTVRFGDGGWWVNGAPCGAADIPAQVAALASDTPRRSERPSRPPSPGVHAGFLLATPAYGQMKASTFAALADLAASQGDGVLRPTPWKSICMAGLVEPVALLDAVADLGLIVDSSDSRLSILTCAGAPACGRAEVQTHAAADFLARHRRPGSPMLHVSGCAKGCAHPGATALTLTGRAGRFDVVRAGTARDTPAIRDLDLAQIPALLHSLPHE